MNFDLRDYLSNTPLHYAAAKKNTEVVKVFLENFGLKYYRTNNEGRPCQEMGSWYEEIRDIMNHHKQTILKSIGTPDNKWMRTRTHYEETHDFF